MARALGSAADTTAAAIPADLGSVRPAVRVQLDRRVGGVDAARRRPARSSARIAFLIANSDLTDISQPSRPRVRSLSHPISDR